MVRKGFLEKVVFELRFYIWKGFPKVGVGNSSRDNGRGNGAEVGKSKITLIWHMESNKATVNFPFVQT